MPAEAIKISESLDKIMQEQILPLRKRYEMITQLLDKLLPAYISRHCKIVQVSDGYLKIETDSPSYMYELQLRSSDILEQIKSFCPGIKIKKIKFTLG